MDFLAGKPVSITAAQTQAHGLLPFEVSFDMTGSGMAGSLFPNPNVLVSLSGPPGGPSNFLIRVIRAKAGEPLPTLEAVVKEEDRPGSNFELGIAQDIELAGAKRPALSWSVKVGPWSDSNATVLIPFPDNRHALLISFSASYDKTQGIRAGHSQLPMVQTLKINLKP